MRPLIPPLADVFQTMHSRLEVKQTKEIAVSLVFVSWLSLTMCSTMKPTYTPTGECAREAAPKQRMPQSASATKVPTGRSSRARKPGSKEAFSTGIWARGATCAEDWLDNDPTADTNILAGQAACQHPQRMQPRRTTTFIE